MPFTKGYYDISNPSESSNFAEQLGLKNLGISVYVLKKNEGFDFFHNHREQEEVYFCLSGSADLIIRERSEDGSFRDTNISIGQGEIVRVSPQTLRAIGNKSSSQAVMLIAGAMPHTYPAGYGHHDVIADVLSIVGQGETGFSLPQGTKQQAEAMEETDC